MLIPSTNLSPRFVPVHILAMDVLSKELFFSLINNIFPILFPIRVRALFYHSSIVAWTYPPCIFYLLRKKWMGTPFRFKDTLLNIYIRFLLLATRLVNECMAYFGYCQIILCLFELWILFLSTTRDVLAY